MSMMLLALYCVKLELSDRRNNLSYKKYISFTQEHINTYQYLLNALSSEIHANLNTLNYESLKEFLSNKSELKITYNNSYLKYDDSNNTIVIVSYEDEYYHKEEIYSYEVEENQVKFIIKMKKTVEGRAVI